MPAAEGTGAMSPKVRPSARAVGQVMAAVKNSKAEAGPTMTEIVKFISAALLNPATKRQVLTALKRGVEFGILKRRKGHYMISPPEESLDVPIQKVRGLKSKLDKVKKRRVTTGAKVRRTGGKTQNRRNPDLEEPQAEPYDVYRNPSYRPSAFSSATTLYHEANGDVDFDLE